MAELITKRQRYESLRAQLENERSSFLAHWRDLADYVSPRRPRFTVSDVNKGDRRNQKIIDSSATMAHRTLRSGMMSGITSPARPWFRLSVPDPELAEFGPVRNWLHDVGQRMSTIFLKSNVYNSLPSTYGDLGLFGTAGLYIESDMDDVIRTCTFPIGSYTIGNGARGTVEVFQRDFRMTVRQMVEKFGKYTSSGAPDWNIFSTTIKNHWDRGMYDVWMDVCHVIVPNQEYNPKKLESKFKKYASCYYERGYMAGSNSNYLRDDGDRYLNESGYDFFPVLCPRWEVTGEDVYGTNCPGMEALGDIKQLQLMEKRGAQALEKMINPPLVGSSQLKTTSVSILPGNINYEDVREGQRGLRPVHEVNPPLQALEAKEQIIRQRISRAFYEDLFLMLAQSDRRQITAREIEERHEEKLLALGPVLEQLNQDLLDPLIDATFSIMNDQGYLPPPPEELQGQDLKVEYLSIMAQAQKAIGIGTIERFTGFVGGLTQANPSILDKVDMDQLVDTYGDALSIPPAIIRTDEQVQQIRSNREKAQQNQQMVAMVQQGAGAAKDLSQSDMEGDNALTRLLETSRAGQLTP